MMMLIYQGGGAIIGVPARNLTDDEVKEHGRERLIESGLYKEPEKPKPAENKIAARPQESKDEV
jgi:hypothetical protein